MVADIASGNLDAADIFFLIATILCVLGALLMIPRTAPDSAPGARAWAGTIAWIGVACIAFAFLLL